MRVVVAELADLEVTFGVRRLAFGVWRLAFGVRRSAFGGRQDIGVWVNITLHLFYLFDDMVTYGDFEQFDALSAMQGIRARCRRAC